jgi:tetratricopeptide (TPR) repeat protein
MALGRAEEAEPYSREALEMKRKLYGDMHPETASALNNLAYVFEARGQYRAAETQYREALGIFEKLLPKGHPIIASTLTNLAFIEYTQGKRQEAIAQQRIALEMNRRASGADADVAGSAATLAYWLIDAGQYDEASQLIEESLRIRRKVLGERHAQVASSLNVKATLLLATRRYEKARDVARDSQQILKESLPDDNWLVAYARSVEGAALAHLGEFEEGERLLLASRAGLTHAPIPDLPAKGDRWLKELYMAWGKPEKAEQLRAAQ